MERYNHLNTYLKNKFGERTLKICIDGGFTCPNRDGKVSTGGCIFCSQSGSGEHLMHSKDITMQVKKQLDSYKSKRANKFIAYFQNFTNTYDSIANLKAKYDKALIDNRIVALSIATRPDCIDEKVAKLLHSYTNNYHVFVELGLQTSDEEIGKLINRCYSNSDFSNAVNILRNYGIDIIVHIMVGLPTETKTSLENTINFINTHDIQGIKIHSCYVLKNTQLANLLENGSYFPISLEYYLDSLEYIITHLRPDIIIHRITGDAPKELLVAPSWNLHKKWILNGIEKRLKEKDLFQGKFFEKNSKTY